MLISGKFPVVLSKNRRQRSYSSAKGRSVNIALMLLFVTCSKLNAIILTSNLNKTTKRELPVGSLRLTTHFLPNHANIPWPMSVALRQWAPRRHVTGCSVPSEKTVGRAPRFHQRRPNKYCVQTQRLKPDSTNNLQTPKSLQKIVLHNNKMHGVVRFLLLRP